MQEQSKLCTTGDVEKHTPEYGARCKYVCIRSALTIYYAKKPLY